MTERVRAAERADYSTTTSTRTEPSPEAIRTTDPGLGRDVARAEGRIGPVPCHVERTTKVVYEPATWGSDDACSTVTTKTRSPT